MVYSCAYFRSADSSLESAQVAKLEHICRKLRMRPGDGTFATGCTLSENQRLWAASQAEFAGLTDRVSFEKIDYREVAGRFDRIASVGMFEHVGRTALEGYFHQIASLLAEGGMFLNHGIVRPSTAHSGPETVFLTRYVFPGAELVQLTDVLHCAQRAGFESRRCRKSEASLRIFRGVALTHLLRKPGSSSLPGTDHSA